MKGTVAALSVALVLVVGCSSRPRYTLEPQNIHTCKGTLPLKVAVTTFTDARPPEERAIDARNAKGGTENAEEYLDSYTYDNDWTDSQVAGPLSDMTAEHLEEARVFTEVGRVGVPSEQVTPDRAKNGDFKGYDAVLIAKISHMYGYMYKSTARQILFLPMGGTGLALNTAIPAPIKGQCDLIEVKLIRTTDAKVLWQGEASAKVEEDKMFNNTKRMTAMALWRKMINKLSQDIEEAAPSITSK